MHFGNFLYDFDKTSQVGRTKSREAQYDNAIRFLSANFVKFNVKIAVSIAMLDSSRHNKRGGGKIYERAEPNEKPTNRSAPRCSCTACTDRKYSLMGCVRTEPFSPCSEKRPNNRKVGLFKRGPWRRIV